MKPKSKEKFANSNRKLGKLSLTKTSYKKESDHDAKIITILTMILQNGPLSKWDLSTVPYRQSIKKGFTPFSWVLVHKLISEMLEIELIQKHGKSKITKSINKKHVVDLYYPTLKGCILAALAEKKIFYLMSEEKFIETYFHKYKNEISDLMSFLEIIWNINSISSDAGEEIRFLAMGMIIESQNSTNMEGMFINVIVSYIISILSKNVSSTISHSLNGLKGNVTKFIALKAALSNVKDRRIRTFLGLALKEKIIILKFNLRLAKWLQKDVGVVEPDAKKLIDSMESSLDQIFLRLSTSSELGGVTILLKPAMKMIKNLGVGLDDISPTSDDIERLDRMKDLSAEERTRITSEKLRHAENCFRDFMNNQ